MLKEAHRTGLPNQLYVPELSFYSPMGEEPFYFLEKKTKTKTTFLDSDRWDFIPKNCFFFKHILT
jgi:hypothetical protein